MSKCDLSHEQYGTDARNFSGYKKCRCLATSGDTSKQHEESNDGRLYGHSAPGFELEWAVPNDA